MKRKHRAPPKTAASGSRFSAAKPQPPTSRLAAAGGVPPPTRPGAPPGESPAKPSLPPALSRHIAVEALLTFLLIFGIYRISPIVTSGDSHFVIPTALTILRHGHTDIDRYTSQFPEAVWAARWSYYHFYNAYPIGVPFVVLPMLAVVDRTDMLRGIDLESAAIARSPLQLELTLASLITAFAVVLFFLYCRARIPLSRSLVLTLLFAFGTSAYSSASRGLWAHAPSLLLFTATILVIGRLDTGKWMAAALAGLLSGASFGVRPSALAIIGVLALPIAVRNWRWLFPYALGAVAGVAPVVAYHFAVYHSALSPYFKMTMSAANAPQNYAALWGLLFSPSRGLFVFSPFLLFAFLRFAPSTLKRRPLSMIEIALAILAVAWWYGTGKWVYWWAGGSFGPRILCDLLPCLLILMIPVVEGMAWTGPGAQRATVAVFVILSAASIAIHARAATSQAVWQWNLTPVPIDAAPDRVWSWKDPQFLRGIRK